MATEATIEIERLTTGIAGFDAIALGGLPRGRATLLIGTAGSGKTVFAGQFLAVGAREFGEAGVYVCFDEAPAAVLRNSRSFAWRLDELHADGRIRFVDSSPPADDSVEVGGYDLSALLARVRDAIRQTGATRVVLDSVTALLAQFDDQTLVRRELGRVVQALSDIDVTTVMTAERTEEYGSVGRWGVEEFMADAVVVLRNPLEENRRRRTIEVLKLRGGGHHTGEFPFTVTAPEGVAVIPLSAIELDRSSTTDRISLGNEGIDRLFGGGVYRDSLILVSGPTGTGKTLMCLGFMQAAVKAGERALMFAFEESHNQVIRNASSWLAGLPEAEAESKLRIHATYPERMGLEDLLQAMGREIDEFEPRRVALDSLTALERVSSQRAFREFVVRLTAFLKEREIAALFTNTSSMISGGETVTDAYVSTITDGIVLLRYAEIEGSLRRAIAALKMRGSDHDRLIREFRITDRGMEVGEPIDQAGGLILRHGETSRV